MTDPTPPVDEIASRISDNTALAHRLASRYARGLGNDDDLRQVAMMGLVLAAQRYDASAGPFRPFAVATISGELKKHLRDNGWAVRVPRKLQEQTITVERAAADLTQQLGRSPTAHEIGSETGLSVDEVLGALRATEARFRGELPREETSPRAGGEATPIDLTDKLVVTKAISQLHPDEGQLFEMRYLHELTQRQIGEQLGVSQSQVHRRLNDLHDHLRTLFNQSDYKP